MTDETSMIVELFGKVAALEKDRDAWKRRAEAAERDLGALRPCYCCEHYRKELAESGREFDPVCREKCIRASEWAWRGPCAENGGMKP